MKKLQRRVEKFTGLSVGLDLHKRFIQASILDPQGDELDNPRIPADEPSLTRLFDRLQALPQARRGLRVAMEASGCFVWVFDLLKARLGADAVRVAAPSKVNAIATAGEKTDATDAWWLAYLLQEGRLPEAFVAEGDLRRASARERIKPLGDWEVLVAERNRMGRTSPQR